VGDLNLARDSLIVFEGKIPSGAQEFGWRYPENYGSNVLRLRYASSEDMQAFFLLAGETAKPFELTETIVQRSRLKVAIDYVGIGFTHILPLGLDHILFVLGIFLLSLRLSPILWQVTAFTIAHTITLGLSIYGLISLPSSIVEPLIALSIVYVGVENILIGELRSWRVVIVFLFGLLHGLGFAGILIEIGLPRSEFLTALITFNVGVEFGQLAVISIALLAVGWFRHRPWYRSGIVVPASAMISIIGLYWTIERVL
jgi:hydrogenase/urease accessory protein HupE